MEGMLDRENDQSNNCLNILYGKNKKFGRPNPFEVRNTKHKDKQLYERMAVKKPQPPKSTPNIRNYRQQQIC